jgi:hypothetical protein
MRIALTGNASWALQLCGEGNAALGLSCTQLRPQGPLPDLVVDEAYQRFLSPATFASDCAGRAATRPRFHFASINAGLTEYRPHVGVADCHRLYALLFIGWWSETGLALCPVCRPRFCAVSALPALTTSPCRARHWATRAAIPVIFPMEDRHVQPISCPMDHHCSHSAPALDRLQQLQRIETVSQKRPHSSQRQWQTP